MAIAEMFFWWYASGWAVFIKKVKGWFEGILDFFSMDSLVRTLFKPFRQISAETAGVDASLEKKMQMLVDRAISRLVGFVSRLILLIVGVILIVIGGAVCLVLVIAWPVIPFLPVVGLMLTLSGVAG